MEAEAKTTTIVSKHGQRKKIKKRSRKAIPGQSLDRSVLPATREALGFSSQASSQSGTGAAETMVGIFSRFSAGAHRRAKSAAEVVETLAPNMNTGESDPAAVPLDSPHGIEVSVEFKPVEHPVEPVNLDQPVKCPLPEPSILHDGRIWKERMSTAGAMVRTDLPVVKEGSQFESDSSGTRSRSAVPRRAILPSVSAPEHNILALLDECDAPESQHPAE